MAKNDKNNKDELVTSHKSVHVIFLSCPHCSNEIDHIQTCPECAEPMRVIDVVEKFGEDAERFLKRMQKRQENGKAEDIEIDKEEPNIILMGEDELDDEGIDPNGEDQGDGLDVIFPGEEEDDSRKEISTGVDDDLTKALDMLDSEDDENVTAQDFGFDDGEIPEL